MKKNLSNEYLPNKYLSIGEVSKIMSVSHTSLRYYDEIGILKPAYINQDTGYRYYAKNQMPILSFILLAIDLDIPLKEFEKYLNENSDIDLEKFILYAKEKVHNSIKKLQRDLYFLNTAEQHFQVNDEKEKEMNTEKEYIKQINIRYFLTLPCLSSLKSDSFDISDYWKKMTDIYNLIRKYELSASVEQGLLCYKDDNEILTKYFVEIKKVKMKSLENAEIFCIPKSDYLCSFYPDSCMEEARDKYIHYPSFNKGNFLIISDILEKKASNKIIPFEIQLMK